jgi:hypothetical protein
MRQKRHKAVGFPNFHVGGGTVQGTFALNFTHALAMQAEHTTALIASCLIDGIREMEMTPQGEDRGEPDAGAEGR